MSEPWKDALKALRDEASAPADEATARRTRQRVLMAARAKRQKRARLGTILLPIAAAFVATGAWAGASGKLAAVVQLLGGGGDAPAASTSAPPRVSRAPAGPRSVPAPTIPDEAPTPEVANTPAPTPPSAPEAPAPAPPPAPDAPPAPAVPPRVEAPAPEPIPPSPRANEALAAAPAPSAPVAATSASAPPAADPTDALYRSAHDLQFRGGDPSGAVAAWDRYLAAAPRGRFAPEARYNRAIALLRAGRRAEGLAALEPFANGAYGSYRREEARQILDAAASAAPP